MHFCSLSIYFGREYFTPSNTSRCEFVIFGRNLFKFNHFLYLSNVALALLIGIFFLMGIGFFLAGYAKKPLAISPFAKQMTSIQLQDFTKIGEGALHLQVSSLSRMARDIKNELLFIGIYPKEVRSPKEDKFVIGLKTSREKKIISPSEPIFLGYSQDSHTLKWSLHFSNGKTSCYIKLKADEEKVLSAEVFEEGLEISSFLARKSSPLSKKEEDLVLQKKPFASLRQAKFWGSDKLLQHYGGETLEGKKDKNRLEFQDSGVSYVLYLSEGDCLHFSGDKWEILPLDKSIQFVPLARVASISSSYLELEGWDELGHFSIPIKIYTQPLQRIQLKFEEIFSSVRLKTSSQISCLLGKKRVLMKKGDWWIKTNSTWHSVKTLDEMDNILSYKVRGDLFVFDGIEKSQGKTQIKGHFFDSMRTTMQSVSFPLPEKKRAKKGYGLSSERTFLPISKPSEDRNGYFKEPTAIEEDNLERAGLP